MTNARDGNAFNTPKVPATCLICGAAYNGGHELPGNNMKHGLRVFYCCGASLSFSHVDPRFPGVFQLLLKNCATTDTEEGATTTVHL